MPVDLHYIPYKVQSFGVWNAVMQHKNASLDCLFCNLTDIDLNLLFHTLAFIGPRIIYSQEQRIGPAWIGTMPVFAFETQWNPAKLQWHFRNNCLLPWFSHEVYCDTSVSGIIVLLLMVRFLGLPVPLWTTYLRWRVCIWVELLTSTVLQQLRASFSASRNATLAEVERAM